ncbi:MAG: hypothetical protein ACXW0Q_13370 [Methylovulum sp.]
MKYENIESNANLTTQERSEVINQPPKVDMLAKGIATGIVASAIVQTGKGVIATLAKSRLVMFGLGFATGYFAHKYRKEIISVINQATEQGKDFVLRQQENLKDLLAKCQETPQKSDDSN